MHESDRTAGSGRTFGASDDSPTLQPTSGEEMPTLPPGTLLAGRYEIIQTLGVGGMGAVYKAFDRQLTRVVALKTILPELASTPTATKRFKQEVLLAQQIIHKNVVRIFDIGEDAQTKFITMDFVEGVDLKHVIVERGKLPASEAVNIIRQACQGLEAAHAAGVVHRDLKPQNIMVEKAGHVVVMDFGIAHSGDSRNVTQTGAFLGTPEYMSPEQAQTEEVDARSDIFSLGLIFYEMLTGKLPFHGGTMLETMFKRTKERVIPPAEIERSVPKGANDIVVKCLATAREARYQTVTDLLDALDTFDPTKKVGAADRAKALLIRRAARYRNVVAGAALVLVALVAGFLLRNRFAPKPAVQHPPMTVLVADFSNHTGEPVFDGTLEPVVKIALEGAGFITAYDRTRMRDLGLAAISGKLDEQAARQIAVGQGLGVVVTGSLEGQGGRYMLSIKAAQAVTGNVIGSVENTVSNKDQVLFATAKLAASVRKALGDDTSDSAMRFATETLSATSLEAVHEYATAMDALSNAKYEDALRSFSKALDIDQNFGLAYAGMAITSRGLGQQQEAEKYIKLALGHIDRMTEREKLRTRGAYFLLLGDQHKCVDEYRTLIGRFPSDAAAHNNLALCLIDLRNLPEALDNERQAAAILSKRAIYRWNTSVYASFGGDFQTGEREARALQALDSSSALPFSALAFAQLGQGQIAQAGETFQKLEKFGKAGASASRFSLADLALYEGRFADAARILEQGAADDLAVKLSDRAALKFAALGYTRVSQGQKGPAVAAAEKALAASKTFKIKFLAGRVLAAAGQPHAMALAAELASEVQAEPQAYGKLIEGESALASADPRKAMKAFIEANNLVNTWIGHFDLGRAYLEAGAFTEADSEFDQCIKRRGEALSLFLDESPTYGYFPPVYYYLGRVREGLKSGGFAESYRTYLSIRGKAGEDPFVADARKRAGQ